MTVDTTMSLRDGTDEQRYFHDGVVETTRERKNRKMRELRAKQKQEYKKKENDTKLDNRLKRKRDDDIELTSGNEGGIVTVSEPCAECQTRNRKTLRMEEEKTLKEKRKKARKETGKRYLQVKEKKTSKKMGKKGEESTKGKRKGKKIPEGEETKDRNPSSVKEAEKETRKKSSTRSTSPTKEIQNRKRADPTTEAKTAWKKCTCSTSKEVDAAGEPIAKRQRKSKVPKPSKKKLPKPERQEDWIDRLSPIWKCGIPPHLYRTIISGGPEYKDFDDTARYWLDSKKLTLADVVTAIHSTGGNLKLAKAALYRLQLTGGVPAEVRHYWTPGNDLMVGSRKMRVQDRMIDKHGIMAYTRRLKFLKEWRKPVDVLRKNAPEEVVDLGERVGNDLVDPEGNIVDTMTDVYVKGPSLDMRVQFARDIDDRARAREELARERERAALEDISRVWEMAVLHNVQKRYAK